MKRFASTMLTMLLAGVLASCGQTGTTATSTATTGSVATAAPAATTAVAAATMAPAATTAVAATAAPAMTDMTMTTATAAATAGSEATMAATTGSTGSMAAPKVTGEVTLWHAYGTGSAEEKALTQIIDKIKAANPDAKINVLQIPFDQVYNKFKTEAAGGAGPDIYIAPNDELGDEVRAGLLAPVGDKIKPYLGNVQQLAIDGCTVDGQLYCVPESLKAVAPYYNKAKVPTPPKTTDELLKLVQGTNTVAINQNAYHNFGFWGAFGGKLFDSSNKIIADQGGFADALTYLATLKKEKNVQFYTDGGKADTAFKEGTADMIINGPWALGDYKEQLKENLAVAPMPGNKNPASPLTGVDGFYLNKNSKNADGAVALAVNMVMPESEQIYVDVAGHVPADKTVKISDPLVQGFADSAANGYPRPQLAELSGYWVPFGDAVNAVLEEGKDPQAAVTEATMKGNEANKK